MRSCPWGEGEGGGRKRKTEGKKSQPPTNGEEGTGETLRARANEQRGETEARARAQSQSARGCSWANFNPWLPGVPWVRTGGREREEGETEIEVDVCRHKLLPAPNPYLFLPNLLGLIDAPNPESL